MVLKEIKRLKRRLYEAIEKYGINADKTRVISEQLDQLINEFNSKQRILSEDNNMKTAYDKSILKLKQITIDFGSFPTVKEWNYFAKENTLLSSESIKYISQLNWNELREKVLHEINKKIF